MVDIGGGGHLGFALLELAPLTGTFVDIQEHAVALARRQREQSLALSTPDYQTLFDRLVWAYEIIENEEQGRSSGMASRKSSTAAKKWSCVSNRDNTRWIYNLTVGWLAVYLPRDAVSEYMRIDWKTVKRCVSRTLHDPRLCVVSWLRTWYELYTKPNVRVAIANCYQLVIETYTIPRIGDIKLNKLTSRNLPYKVLMENGRVHIGRSNGTGLSSTTVRNVPLMLHCAFDRAVKERLIRFEIRNKNS